jgi:hypothetical protein
MKKALHLAFKDYEHTVKKEPTPIVPEDQKAKV